MSAARSGPFAIELAAARSLGRDRLDHVAQRRLQRVPGQGGALDPDRKLAHALEDGELAELARRPRPARWGRRSAARETPRTAPPPRRRVLPLTASVISDAEALEMAHPSRRNLMSTMPSSVELQIDRQPVAAQRVVALGAEWSASSQLAEVPRLLVVIQDHFLVERQQIGHQPKTSRTLTERRDQAVELVARVVEGQRGPRRGRNAEAIHHRLRAVMTDAHGDAFAIEDRADVVRVHTVEDEGQHRRLVLRRADQPHGRESRLERLGARSAADRPRTPRSRRDPRPSR